MNGNDRSRSVNPVNFWSFNFIDVKGLSLQFGSKTFAGFEIAVAVLYFFYVVKKKQFIEVQLSRSAISNPVKVLLPN